MNIESYFTKKVDVRKIILEHLDKATKKVFVAVAWFTDTLLFNKLLELQEKGISVEVIITNHEFNKLDYNIVEQNGGFFAEIGSDYQLMHMKFCIIDYSTVISGSANWSNKAFTKNNEEVTIVSGSMQRANDFVEEFERLKELSGKTKEYIEALDVSKAFKYFKLITAFIDIGEVSNILPYVHEIKKIKELETISTLFLEGKYDVAFVEIEKFEKSYTQVVDITAIEKAQVLSQIKLFNYQIEALELEKTEIEALVEQFNHRYVIELNPFISKILALKKKIYEKLKKYGVVDDTFEKLEKEFNQANNDYQEEIKNEIPELNDNDSADIKRLYREASWLCSPNSNKRVIEDEKEAAKVFDELTKAYKRNDLEKVKFIYNELKLGKSIENIDKFDELEHLKAKLETLKVKHEYLFNTLLDMQNNDSYQMIIKIEDWSAFFETQKSLLSKEFESLTEKYVNNE